ncbi:MAG: Gfo/Idh/MocA family oxidoreductase [Armatimonadetes bacterium]|nr:Gfo/Idh/MocA family oxidoreductase [Armatimonadota bacterium]
MSKTRIALIGCGGISRSHAAGYQRLSDRVEVAYCVDPFEKNAQERAEQLGAKPVASYEGILGEVDGVDICTPHHLHYQAAKDALAADCDVLVEKPMANRREECVELVELAAARDRRLMVAYVLRYMPAMAKLKEVLEAGTYGDLIQVASSVEARVTGEHLPWAAKKDQLGGGVLFSHGCHTLDLMVWFAGRPRRVAMLGNNVNAEWMEGEGTAQVIMEFGSGALGHHTSSWALAHKNAIPSMRVWCRDGFLELRGNNLVALRGTETETLYESPQGDVPAMSRQIEHYIETIRTRACPLTDGATALASLDVIWAAYESRETSQFVELT